MKTYTACFREVYADIMVVCTQFLVYKLFVQHIIVYTRTMLYSGCCHFWCCFWMFVVVVAFVYDVGFSDVRNVPLQPTPPYLCAINLYTHNNKTTVGYNCIYCRHLYNLHCERQNTCLAAHITSIIHIRRLRVFIISRGALRELLFNTSCPAQTL